MIFFSLLLDWGGAGCVAGLMIEVDKSVCSKNTITIK